jgi:FixJ family two-component response regulator
VTTAQVNRTIFLIDDDVAVCHALSVLLEMSGYRIRTYHSAESFLGEVEHTTKGIVLVDQRLTGMSGLELQAELANRGIILPIIFISGHGDIQMSVKAIKNGAINFLEKPLNNEELLTAIREAFSLVHAKRAHHRTVAELTRCHANLTSREWQVMGHVAAGKTNKEIAHLLGLSMRTIEVHRKSVMKKMVAESVPDLVRKYAMYQDAALIHNANQTKK